MHTESFTPIKYDGVFHIYENNFYLVLDRYYAYIYIHMDYFVPPQITREKTATKHVIWPTRHSYSFVINRISSIIINTPPPHVEMLSEKPTKNRSLVRRPKWQQWCRCFDEDHVDDDEYNVGQEESHSSMFESSINVSYLHPVPEAATSASTTAAASYLVDG